MPKIFDYSNTLSEEVHSTLLSDPLQWHWNKETMYPLQNINGYIIIGDYATPNHIQYGIFKNESNINSVVCGMSINIESGESYNLPIKEVAVIENVTTKESERNKGFARTLYDFVLNKFKVLISDIKLFTHNGINKSLGIWSNYLTTISKVFNYNTKSKQYSNFDIKSGNNEDTRFVAIKNDSISNKLTESLKNLTLKGLTGLALAGGGIGAIGMGNDDNYNNIKSDNANIVDTSIPRLPDDFKTYYSTDKIKPTENKTQQSSIKIQQPENKIKSNKIDVNIISKIESNNKRKAVSKDGHNTRGLCQIGKNAWDESQKDLYGKIKYPFEKYAFNASINKEIANNYYNEILPEHLDSFGLPVTIDTLIASYNFGSNNVKKLMKKYGKNWKKHLPDVTKNYLDSYKNLVEK